MYYTPMAQIDNFITDPVLQYKLFKIYTSELYNLHFGQNWDIHWHNGKVMPTEQQYLQMVINKTSVLPRLCTSMIAAILDLDKEKTQKINHYVESLGAAF